jgi:putative transposase
MRSSTFDAGTVFREGDRHYVVVEGGSRNRVLRDQSSQEVTTRSLTQLRQSYVNGALQFEDLAAVLDSGRADGDASLEKSLLDYSQRDRDAVKVKLHFLNAICPRGYVACRRAELRAQLHRLFQELPEALRPARPPGVSTFYDWRHSWVNSGFSSKRLVNRHDLKGRRPQETPVEIQPILERAVDVMYATGNRPSIQDALDEAEAEVNRQNLVRAPQDQLPRPTRRQVERAISKVDRYLILQRRHGTAHARSATRVFARRELPKRLGERVEVDHTPLDLICFADETGLVVGRPYLTVFIDVASRMILGVWISFREPNADTVLRALKHAILPKDEILTRYGIKGEWPACGTPSVIFMDNGKEFLGHALEGAALELGFSVVHCPPRQPFFKGVVERWLQEINYRFIHLLPGTTFAKYHLRKDYDSLKHAVIPVEDLQRLVYRWVVEVYSTRFHSTLQTCPLLKWKELEHRGKPALPRNAAALDVFLMPSEARMLGSAGIRINNLFYTSPELSDLRPWKQKLKVKRSLDDISLIYVLHPKTNVYFKARCTWPEYATGLTREQHQWLRKQARESYAASPYRSALLAAKQELHEEARRMLDAHEALRRDFGSSSKAKPKPKAKAKHNRPGASRKPTRSGLETQCRAEAAKAVRKEERVELANPEIVSFEGLTSFASGQSTLF